MLTTASVTAGDTAVRIVQTFVDACSLGGLYALFALGVALIFGIMRLINFAHGDLIMIGALTVALLADIDLWLRACIAGLVVTVLALAMERVAFRPVRSASPATMLVTSFAVSFLAQNLVILIFGSAPRSTTVSETLSGSFSVGDVVISKLNVLTLGLTAFLLVGLIAFFDRTRLGLEMRAAAEDFMTARMLGVRANVVIAAAFAMSGLLAGAAAVLLVAQTGTVSPTMGVNAVLVAFIATVIGGMGSLGGAVLGAFVVGAATVSLQVSLPLEMRPYRDALVFGLVILTLLVRPQGLLGGRGSAGARV